MTAEAGMSCPFGNRCIPERGNGTIDGPGMMAEDDAISFGDRRTPGCGGETIDVVGLDTTIVFC